MERVIPGTSGSRGAHASNKDRPVGLCTILTHHRRAKPWTPRCDAGPNGLCPHPGGIASATSVETQAPELREFAEQTGPSCENEALQTPPQPSAMTQDDMSPEYSDKRSDHRAVAERFGRRKWRAETGRNEASRNATLVAIARLIGGSYVESLR
ncbi:hypothetical protein LTR35_001016 [Friedmanniomyces endolithicus]|uniref:Uncharacterized protein n=1 Tax=Friedmanniomyces endolithicus TaxID=329885 RepID=A0AAN6FD74_9PEZI|nr:hypothetical protein LTS00_013174 [Friedmanniomyces endolithicus]KAK0292985.1 hypothetical protein LTR35_001016 [Friedmanniomyces endolithicus]KAK0310233.1 hypothetical protein LTR82_014915 [Friedmanniomyces endolithicus]KAK1017747.1 hypothetical protein LTR54_002406 [Friedmanniomyces endolithicus]